MSAADAIEVHAARAWPATEVEERDGWLLRHTPAVDRARSNCAFALSDDAALDVPAAWYAARRRPLWVHTREGSARDRELEGLGWVVRQPADVLAAPLDEVRSPTDPVALVTRPSPRWVDAWARAERREDWQAHADHLLPLLAPGTTAFALGARGRSVGIAVERDGLCGLFSLAVREDARRGGHGTAVVLALCDWARSRGAHTVYLQVEQTNEAARAMYDRLGFDRAFSYRCRAAP